MFGVEVLIISTNCIMSVSGWAIAVHVGPTYRQICLYLCTRGHTKTRSVPISCRSSAAGQGKFVGQRPTFYQLCHATNVFYSCSRSSKYNTLAYAIRIFKKQNAYALGCIRAMCGDDQFGCYWRKRKRTNGLLTNYEIFGTRCGSY